MPMKTHYLYFYMESWNTNYLLWFKILWINYVLCEIKDFLNYLISPVLGKSSVELEGVEAHFPRPPPLISSLSYTSSSYSGTRSWSVFLSNSTWPPSLFVCKISFLNSEMELQFSRFFCFLSIINQTKISSLSYTMPTVDIYLLKASAF